MSNRNSCIFKKNGIKGDILYNHSFKQNTWFGVGGPAELFFKPADINDLITFINIKPPEMPITVVGACSNLLIRDGGIRGAVVKLGRAFNQLIVKDKENCIIEAHGAVLSQNLAQYAAENEIGGFEFLYNIPGTIGGGVYMNAGCYGSEYKDIITEIKILNTNGDIIKMSNKDLCFSYRKSSLSKEDIVISAKVTGYKEEKKICLDKISYYDKQRKTTQPQNVRTCGSTFKNTDKYAAWQLIKESGCADLKIGGAFFSSKHANFIINEGNTAKDIEMLIKTTTLKVKEVFGVDLIKEIKIIGIE